MTVECYIVVAGFVLSAIIAFTILIVELYGTIKYYPTDIWCNPISKFFNTNLGLTYRHVDSIWRYANEYGPSLGARGVIVPSLFPLVLSIVISVSMLSGYLWELLASLVIILFLYIIRHMRMYLWKYCKVNFK